MLEAETVGLLRTAAAALDFDPILEFSPEGRAAVRRVASVSARDLLTFLNAREMRSPNGRPVTRSDRKILHKCAGGLATRAEIHRLQDLIWQTTAGVACAEIDPALCGGWLAPAPLVNKYRTLCAHEGNLT